MNEIDKNACLTLKKNRSEWNVVHEDIAKIDFKQFHGKKLGFEDVRGTMFYQFARAVKEIRPRVFMGENVRGLLKHDNGRTIETIKGIIRNFRSCPSGWILAKFA